MGGQWSCTGSSTVSTDRQSSLSLSTVKRCFNALQFDDDLAEELAPGCGGVQGLQAQLLRLQKAKTAQDNEEAVDEALMASVVHLVECDVPQSMTEEMGQQEYQARLHTAQAKVGRHGNDDA